MLCVVLCTPHKKSGTRQSCIMVRHEERGIGSADIHHYACMQQRQRKG